MTEGTNESANEVMDRAIRRLGILEYLFLGLAAGGALLAGALIAWLLRESLGWNFRVMWAVTSLLLFLVPGSISWWRLRREERSTPQPHDDDRNGDA
ncbi:MAG TPA: hypothetical protein VK858_19335 [Longimicrobiales bacterium]|nr:hypothetical protein [Longimicrobiales bacterium]